jgi:hypothetical protein
VAHRFGTYPLTNHEYIQKERTASIIYVRSVGIANATNTTTTAPLLLLLSIYVLACNYPWGVVSSHLHFVLNKHFLRDYILFTFVQLIIFLYAKSSFIFSQLLFTHSSLHLFFVSERFSNMCLASSTPKHRGHLLWGNSTEESSDVFNEILRMKFLIAIAC